MKLTFFLFIWFLLFSCDNNKFNSERELVIVDSIIFVHGATVNDIAIVRCKKSDVNMRVDVIKKDSVRIKTLAFKGETIIFKDCYVQIYK